MRLVALSCLLIILAMLSMLLSVGCDDLTTEVNNNTYFDSTLGEDCLRCHSDDDNAIKQPKGQWATSQHASPELIEATVTLNTKERKSNVCGPQCHTSEGFIAFTANGSTSTQQTPSVIDCFTCHMPHTGDYGSWKIDTLRGFQVPVILTGDFEYDMGNSNMCVTCHQAETVPVIPTNALTVRLDTLGMDGPHNSAQAQMLIGRGGFRFTTDAVTNSHVSVETKEGCLSCHFGTGLGYQFGEHTFRLEDDQTNEQYVANCNLSGCHTGASVIADFDGAQTQDSIRSLSSTLAGYMISAHLLTGTDEDSTEYYIDSTVSADAARILYNYLFVKKDGSRGIHNANYALTLLRESIIRWDSIPQASFSTDFVRGCAPQLFDFTNTSTGVITSYKWDFGTDNLDSAISRDTVFTFTKPDSYFVKLTVTGIGGQDSYTQLIVIDTLPITAIDATDSTINTGIPVELVQISSNYTSLLWDFGDGRLDTLLLNPTISYPIAGTYVVRFTVTNDCGSSTDSVTIDVTAP